MPRFPDPTLIELVLYLLLMVAIGLAAVICL